MDPVTHGIVGATCSQFFSDKETIRTASVIGFISALAPDLDVFLGSDLDPLSTIELHRHFTHSVLFTPIGALIVSGLLWWFVRKKLSFKATYLFSLAGYATAGLMDYITSYGVYLFWPVLDDRFSLSIVSVFDPLLTLGVLILFSFAIYQKKKKLSIATIAWLFLYLSFAMLQQSRVEHAALSAIPEASQSETKLIMKPTIGNQLLWSVRFMKEDELCSMGVRSGIFSESKIYLGECKSLLDWETEYESFSETILYDDIRRFSELSDGYLVRHPNHPEVIGDGRYSMLPTTVSPLWGITIDTTKTSQHVAFDSYRDTSPETRESFLEMLFGK